jgi:hypothetical protein
VIFSQCHISYPIGVNAGFAGETERVRQFREIRKFKMGVASFIVYLVARITRKTFSELFRD